MVEQRRGWGDQGSASLTLPGQRRPCPVIGWASADFTITMALPHSGTGSGSPLLPSQASPFMLSLQTLPQVQPSPWQVGLQIPSHPSLALHGSGVQRSPPPTPAPYEPHLASEAHSNALRGTSPYSSPSTALRSLLPRALVSFQKSSLKEEDGLRLSIKDAVALPAPSDPTLTEGGDQWHVLGSPADSYGEGLLEMGPRVSSPSGD